MPWREIFIGVCFFAAVALAAAAYFWRDEDWQPFAAVLLAAGTLFTGAALLLDDWVIVVALAAGAVTAVAVTYGGFGLADRFQSSGPDPEPPAEPPRPVGDSAERLERWREEREHAQLEVERKARMREELAAAAAALRSESVDERFAAVSELAALSASRHGDRIRDLLEGHVRIRTHGGDKRVSPDVEAALAVLGRHIDRYGSSSPRRVNLARAQLRGLVLADADLQGAVLVRADLEGALLEQVNLAGARLTEANLRGVRFNGVDLSGAALFGADLTGATLEPGNLGGATYDETTKWPEGFNPPAA